MAACFRQPEVEQLRAALGQHHVTRLQIAMHHVVSMCRIESVRDLNPDLQRLVDRQRAFLQPVGERLTVEQLHHEERRAVVLSYVMERADMRVRQLRDGSRFPVQPVFELRVPSERGAQDLDGDGPVEPRVARLVDFAHAPRAERREDLVGAEASANGQGHESTPIVATMPVVIKANRSGRHPALSQRLQQIIAQPSERNASWNLAGFTLSARRLAFRVSDPGRALTWLSRAEHVWEPTKSSRRPAPAPWERKHSWQPPVVSRQRGVRAIDDGDGRLIDDG